MKCLSLSLLLVAPCFANREAEEGLLLQKVVEETGIATSPVGEDEGEGGFTERPPILCARRPPPRCGSRQVVKSSEDENGCVDYTCECMLPVGHCAIGEQVEKKDSDGCYYFTCETDIATRPVGEDEGEGGSTERPPILCARRPPPRCGSRQVVKSSEDENGCVDYTCECMLPVGHCAIGQQVEKQDSDGCYYFTCDCPLSALPTCPEGQQPQLITLHNGCPSYECGCISIAGHCAQGQRKISHMTNGCESSFTCVECIAPVGECEVGMKIWHEERGGCPYFTCDCPVVEWPSECPPHQTLQREENPSTNCINYVCG